MGKVEKFEDLIAWQRARELTALIYQVTRKGEFAKDFGLANQIQRASVSVMANIAEGFERGTRPEFHRFLFTAKASCAELRSHLYIAFDAGYLTQDVFDDIFFKAQEVARIIGGLRASVKQRMLSITHYS